VRDLGGLETAAGGRTRHGAVVRADNVRGLTATGWEAALAHGVRRVVDLRFANEVPGEPPAHEAVEVVSVSLFGRYDPVAARAAEAFFRTDDDLSDVVASRYTHTLVNRAEGVGAAVAAVADADPGTGVVVHCFAGKDRTGIVSALLLALADVPDEIVAADYQASEPGVEALSQEWFAAAADDAELAFRRRICRAPGEGMRKVLAWLHESAGGPAAYLRQAGLTERQLERLRARLVEQ
jgi:protein-tyrosine phosphatase